MVFFLSGVATLGTFGVFLDFGEVLGFGCFTAFAGASFTADLEALEAAAFFVLTGVTSFTGATFFATFTAPFLGFSSSITAATNFLGLPLLLFTTGLAPLTTALALTTLEPLATFLTSGLLFTTSGAATCSPERLKY